LKFSKTVLSHTERPYSSSKLLIKEIIENTKPIADPQGTQACYWKVAGKLNKQKGEFELLIDPKSNTVWHFLFKGFTTFRLIPFNIRWI